MAEKIMTICVVDFSKSSMTVCSSFIPFLAADYHSYVLIDTQ